MNCKYCNQDKLETEFYVTNKAKCKTCIKQAKEERKKNCPVEGCIEIIDHRSKMCKTHQNLAMHNGIDKDDIVAISRLACKEYWCPVPGCGIQIKSQSTMCSYHANIFSKNSQLNLVELSNWITRDQGIARRKSWRTNLIQNGLVKCGKCEQVKPLNCFSQKNLRKSGATGQCKQCNKDYSRDYYHRIEKHNTTIKLRRSVSKAIRYALHAIGLSKQGQSCLQYLPYTIAELHQHLELQFDSKMTWGNYGSYWCIDHIIPQAYFSYKTYNDMKFRECWALSNLRPMNLLENSRKSSTFNGKRFIYS